MKISKPESEENIAKMFDRIAFRYDFLNSLLSFSQDKRWRKHLISWLPLATQGRLLDVACGTGDVVLAAYRKCHPQYKEFIGVDISEGMLAKAKDKASGKNISFRTMSAEKLDFPSQSFTALTISFGLRNVVDRGRAIREFSRVLKPHGSLLVLEFFPVKNGLLNRLFQFYFRWVLPVIGGLLSDRAAYSYLPQSVGGFLSVEELAKLAEKEGLRLKRKRNFLFGSCVLLDFIHC